MAKEIHMILSREGFEELKKLHLKLSIDYKPKFRTYEEYLEEEKKNPTMVLFS